ncbi:MAG: hypothetical protein HND53_01820 [Proteobacteria bacterium]|nr:hypothetical protein [Pseudomonadota bacterium]NOG59208.1 hypothetical protein [Pseudomonadota bacterium]
MREIFVAIMLLLGSGSVIANEYPTNETVHFALRCMDELGGQTEENLYTCACRYDAIREAMTYSDYEEGYTFERNKKMPGEKGAAFRDNERGKRFYEVLLKAREAANASCIVVKHVKMVKPTVVEHQRK